MRSEPMRWPVEPGPWRLYCLAMLALLRLRLIPVAALLCLALASCGWDDRGPNIRLPGSNAQSPSQTAGSGIAPVTQVSQASAPTARLAYPADGRHTVQPGETLFDIARNYGLPLRAMIEANRLEPPYALSVGQVLTLPPPNVHVVQRGETLYSVSRRYGAAVSELARLNGLAEPFTIFVGQALSIPGRVEPEPPAIATIPAPPPSPAEGASDPPTPLSEDQTVTPSMEDTPEESLPGELASRPPERPAPPGRAPNSAGAGTQQRPTVNSDAVAIPSPAPRDASTFLWPVRGTILSGFGPKNGGLHNDGINIAAPRGTPIRAAENGVVAYAGNQLEGFGNLILVRHADGYMTAYAHAEALLVERGQKVERGQTIARVGSSGNVDTPQLHFEVRRGTSAVDPTRFLGG